MPSTFEQFESNVPGLPRAVQNAPNSRSCSIPVSGRLRPSQLTRDKEISVMTEVAIPQVPHSRLGYAASRVPPVATPAPSRHEDAGGSLPRTENSIHTIDRSPTQPV
jgi:hypothetical protein